MESAKALIKLSDIPIGGRVLVRSRVDWRTAVVSRITDEGITLSVASPKGRNYRLRRTAEHAVGIANGLPFLVSETRENWNENFAVYDSRW